MTTRTISLGTPYRWLAEAFAMCRAHPRVLFGAASMLLMVALLPTLAQVLLEAALRPSAGGRAVIQVLFSLLALILFPPVVGGFYRIVHALHEGRPAHALELFAVFQDAAAARRLIAANLVFVVVSILLIVGIAFGFGGQDMLDFLRTVATLKPGATELPPLPAGFLLLMSTLLIVALVIMTAQGLATAQVALSERSPLPAVGDGFKVALRNIGALLLFYLPVAVIGFIVAMVLALVAALVGAMLSVVSPVLATLLIAPVSLVIVLVLYVLMFTFFYHAWRETLASAGSTPSGHQIAA